MSEGC